MMKATVLTDEHRALGARLAEFAGWEMPLWYAGASQEHTAVRQAAGLFDIGHMGVLEIAGEDAAEFLDDVTTARASQLEVGRCRYTFLLGHDGLPIDDVIICPMAPERFVMVVNASNADAAREWLSGLAQGRTPLGVHDPASAREFDLTLRELTAQALGDERLTGMALQGPDSRRLLAGLVEAPVALDAMSRFMMTEATMLGAPALLSRTGYTGEAIGFELFVPAGEAVRVWRALLEAGATPAGLAARDSLRIEAGLPLFGHELVGRHEITPFGAGYGRFLEADKPFFVGGEALLAREESRGFEVIRFSLNEPGARAIRADDPVGSGRGQMIGWVTSCALAGELQCGMAWIDRKLAREGSELLLYPARHLERAADTRDVAALKPGDHLPMHETATVLTRFRR